MSNVEPPAKTTYTFIDNAAIDSKSRRVIRSHVMKGKHVGRVHVGRGRRGLDQAAPSKPSTQPGPHTQIAATIAQGDSAPLPLPRTGNVLLGVSHTSQITPDAKRYAYTFLNGVIKGLYPPDICHDSKLQDMIWFVYFFGNEASIEFTHGRRNSSSRHLVQALRLTNENLSGPQALSDTTIACVVSLCYISMICEDPPQTKIHFNGLVRMIQARGGLLHLHSDEFLAPKAQHIDIVLALQLGCSPCLDQMTKPLGAIHPLFTDRSLIVSSPLPDAVRNSNREVYQAAIDVLKMSYIFNSRTSTTKLTPDEFSQILITIRYHLLGINILGGNKLRDPVANVVHLGLSAFMTMFGTHFGHQGKVPLTLFFNVMRSALEDQRLRDSLDLGTHLWLLVITGISIASPEGHIWLAHHIRTVTARLGRSDWHFAQQILSLHPWVGCLHDKVASQLWDSIFGSPNPEGPCIGFRGLLHTTPKSITSETTQ
ncbi:hypothetical protein HJFPF1_07897 [Paramyrothecium foliicola]|nr:hypothetical protein HJFPF1_07897 [Paramyrothecium foliicola]